MLKFIANLFKPAPVPKVKYNLGITKFTLLLKSQDLPVVGEVKGTFDEIGNYVFVQNSEQIVREMLKQDFIRIGDTFYAAHDILRVKLETRDWTIER